MLIHFFFNNRGVIHKAFRWLYRNKWCLLSRYRESAGEKNLTGLARNVRVVRYFFDPRQWLDPQHNTCAAVFNDKQWSPCDSVLRVPQIYHLEIIFYSQKLIRISKVKILTLFRKEGFRRSILLTKNVAFINVIDHVGIRDKEYWWDIKNSRFDQ